MQLIPVALIATAIGLICASYLPTDAPVAGVTDLAGVVLSFLIMLLLPAVRRRPGLLLSLVGAGFLALAVVRYPLELQPRADVKRIDRLARKVTVVAEVVRVSQLNGGRSWLEMELVEVVADAASVRFRKPLRVRLYLGEGTTRLLPGDVLRCRTRLRQPRLFGTPGEFHWPRYLASRDIQLTAWVKSGEQLETIAQRPRFPARFLTAWRNHAATLIAQWVEDSDVPLVRALVLGEGRVLPEQVRALLARAGISHLFAISGLHLGLIGVLAYRVLLAGYRKLPWLMLWQPPQRSLPLLILPGLLVYLLLTGDAVATRRAFALACLGAVLLFMRYPVSPLRLLAALALGALLVNPLLLWQAGWQLSFAGAAGILLWRPWWQGPVQNWSRGGRYAGQILLVTTAATLATLPLVLANFHLLAPGGLLINLFSVPLITLLVLPLGLIGLILSSVVPPLAGGIFAVCGTLLGGLFQLVAWIVQFPGLNGEAIFLSRWQSLAVALLIMPLLIAPRWPARVWRCPSVGVVLLGTLVLWQLPVTDRSTAVLTLFSVGQGESILLQNAAGQSLLVDGGGLYSERFDVGERLLAPAFAELGIERLNAVLLTHDHPDHRKGLPFILANLPVERFVSGQQQKELHPTLRRVLERRKIPFQQAAAGWQALDFWKTGELFLYRNQRRFPEENDNSLVLYLDPGNGAGVLLTGDLEAAGVTELLRKGLPGPLAVLKLPHHGSRYSRTRELVRRYAPATGLVSVGYQNRYRLPAAELVRELHRAGVRLYRTDRDGTVRARLRRGQWHFTTWQQGLFR